MATDMLPQAPEALPMPATVTHLGPTRPRPARAILVRLALAVTTGGLLWACHFPLAWGWLAWIALVPLLCLVRSTATGWRVWMPAWLGGLAFFTPALQWLRVADDRMFYTWIGLSLYCSLFFLAGFLLVRRLDRKTRLPLVVTLPVVWTALEFFRAYFLGGFAWYYLGHTQHDYLPLIQITDLGGVYAVSFLIAAVNGLIFEIGYAWWSSRRPVGKAALQRLPLTVQACAVLLYLSATLGYGFWRLSQSDFAEGPRVALIQGNLDQRIRNQATSANGGAAATTMMRHYMELSDSAAKQSPPPDLIVWPETSCPDEWVEVDPRLPPERVPPRWQEDVRYAHELTRLAGKRWPNVLLGLNGRTLGADELPRRYNSAILVRANGEVAARYDKIHRVPFGEYVPFREALPFMNAFAPYDFDYSISAGERMTRFDLATPKREFTFGVLICYEDTDPSLARQYVDTECGSQVGVDFLVNISNDGWFNGTSEHEEHLAIGRFRAIEARRAMVRAVNMGISAVIDGNGRIVALPGASWAASKKVADVLTATIPLDSRGSAYAATGDWFAWGCTLLLGVGIVASLIPHRRAILEA